MTDYDLTNNALVSRAPLLGHPIPDVDWASWADSLQIGLDYGPKIANKWSSSNPDWNPITYCWDAYGDPCPETNFAKGLFQDGARTVGLYGDYSSYRPYVLDTGVEPWRKAGPRGWDFQPENLGYFTGDVSMEENRWVRGAYSMGIRCMTYGMQNSLNQNLPTTYTFITPEFSYRPGKRELPTTGVGLSHKLVINFQVPWKELRGGKVGGYWGTGLHEAWPHRDTDYPTFGISLERENSTGNLVIRFVCPDDEDWAVEQGAPSLGLAINHDPTTHLLSKSGHPQMRADTGYVLQVFFSEDRKRVAVNFNGETVFTQRKLPTVIQDFFRNPPYTEEEILDSELGGGSPGRTATGVGRGIALSAGTRDLLQTYSPTFWTDTRLNQYGKPTMGLGFAVFDNLVTPVGYTPAIGTDDRCHAVYGFHKATKNAKPFPDEHGNPYYMNRPDGLNSAPPWANAGSPWSKSINRAALWQRNNLR